MPIEWRYITTERGNTLAIFYNPDNNLLVIDILRGFVNNQTLKREPVEGGNEIVRITLNKAKTFEPPERRGT